VPPSDYDDQLAALLKPTAVLTRDDVLTRPCPVPAVSGVYAWYFDQAPPRVPIQGCHHTVAGALLYVGISPKAPPKNAHPAEPPGTRRRCEGRSECASAEELVRRPGWHAVRRVVWRARRPTIGSQEGKELTQLCCADDVGASPVLHASPAGARTDDLLLTRRSASASYSL
jgi:hypothetical protein